MTRVETKIQFDRVIGSKEQIRILYDLLIRRTHSISHQILPTYKSHKEFVLSHPYLAWFIIRSYSEIVGSFYLKHDNSVGLNLIDQDSLYVFEVVHFIKSNFDPQPAMPSTVPPYFYINVAFSNVELKKILKKQKLMPIQTSFML